MNQDRTLYFRPNARPPWRCRLLGHKPRRYLQRSFVSERGLLWCSRRGCDVGPLPEPPA